MKTMNLVFHPDLKASRVNKVWKQQLEDSGKITTGRDMYAEYPDFAINVEREQALLLAHDRIVFQFPVYWWSMPPLMKKWLDDVLQYQFAYGSQGDKLAGKDMQLICSVGGQASNYSGFHMFATVPELFKSMQLTANLAQMNYAAPLYMFNADACPEQDIERYGEQWVSVIDNPERGDGLRYINTKSHKELDDVYQQIGMT
ncbi:MAG: NAD(P)H-dependent oxidoreductase [Pseudomonadota bacterium]